MRMSDPRGELSKKVDCTYFGVKFSREWIVFVVLFIPILLGFYWCMGGSSSTSMASPFVIQPTAKHTASVSDQSM